MVKSYLDTSCNDETVPRNMLINECFNQTECSLTINQSFFQQTAYCQQKLFENNLVLIKILCLSKKQFKKS